MRLTLLCGLVLSVSASATTLAEVQEAHRKRCGGSTVFELDESVKKLKTSTWNAEEACAAAMEAPQQFCTEYEVNAAANTLHFDSAGIDVAPLVKAPALFAPMRELKRIRCIADSRPATGNTPVPFYQWSETELTIGINEQTANLYNEVYRRARADWLAALAPALPDLFAPQLAENFEKRCGAKVSVTIELFGPEWRYNGESATSMVMACARTLNRQLAGSCDAKNKAAAAGVKELRCGPDRSLAAALPCFTMKYEAKADEQEKAKAVMAKKAYEQKKVTPQCEAKLKALPPRNPPTFTWKGSTLSVGMMVDTLDPEDVGRAFKAALKK